MGFTYSNIETIGELRQALEGVSDDVTFTVEIDGEDFRKMEVQSLYDGQLEQFVRIKVTA
jgi:hypothetical protein